ncbi:hypothetical protein TKK_0011260 [Trichogramma kaykai]
MTQIVYWETGNDVNSYVINLLVFRILQFEANEGSNQADEETIRRRIAQLNTTDHWKNIVIQLLLVDFRGQILQKHDESNKNLPQPVSSPAVSQQSQDQFEYLDQYEENVKKIMQIFIDMNVKESSRQSLLKILIADSEAGGNYAEFVLKLINEIHSWKFSAYVEEYVLELLVYRIERSQASDTCSRCEITGIKRDIDQLNEPISTKNKILYFLILNFYDVREQIKQIMIVNNISDDMQNQLLQLLADNSAESNAYAEYILQLMSQIVSWNVGDDIQSWVVDLLVFRVLQFEVNGGSNQADEQAIQSRILQLNTNQSWKTFLIQFLITNFRGQLLHTKSSRTGYSQPYTIQVYKINASGGNQGSCIGSCSGSTQFLPHVDCTKYCQCSNAQCQR